MLKEPTPSWFILEIARRKDLFLCHCQYDKWWVEYFPTVSRARKEECWFTYLATYPNIIREQWKKPMEEIIIGFFLGKAEIWRKARSIADKIPYLTSAERHLAMAQLANIDKWIETKIAMKRTLEYRYRCVNGHDACNGGIYAGPECPYCVKTLVKLTIKDILLRKEKY